MKAIKGLMFILIIIALVFNVWLTYMAFFVSSAFLFGILHAFISFVTGFMLYKMYNNGI